MQKFHEVDILWCMKCKRCGGELKHRDYVKRIVKTKGGEKTFIQIERMICKSCGSIFRILPEGLEPFKHYEKEVINGVIEGLITTDTLGYENFPTELTMERWKKSHKKQTP